jgi:ribosomal protein S18 acetylase RimI-like enzyme
MSLTVREATSADLTTIVDIFLACWRESYQDLLPVEVRDAMTFEAARELWSPATQFQSDRQTFIAEVGELPVGIARIGINPEDPDRGHLFSLYIHPKYAGKGLGKVFLATVIEKMRKHNFAQISLWVFKENLSAQRLYRKSGFLPTGNERTDERWKIPEIEMLNSEITSQI